MFHYSGYKGKSVGRILYCLEVYCQSYHRLFEHAQVGDGTVSYGKSIVATYEWPTEGDTPHFRFEDFDPHHPGMDKRFEEQQYFKKPLIDIPSDLSCVNYVVQEVRNKLTFPEALAVKHVRDGLNGEWNDVTVSPNTAQKIQRTIVNSSGGMFDKHRAFVWWRHFALCAIYCI